MALLEDKPDAVEAGMLEGDEQPSSLTITADELAEQILAKAPQELHEPIHLLVDAGMQALFADDESHHAIFDNINAHDDVPIADEIAVGAVNLTMQIFNETQGNAPEEALIPAGEILMAKVFEFIDQSGIEAVTDQDYADAVEMYRAAMQREAEQGDQQGAMPPEQGAMPPQQAPMPQQGGLLQQPQQGMMQ